jgi:hypothetical protein
MHLSLHRFQAAMVSAASHLRLVSQTQKLILHHQSFHQPVQKRGRSGNHGESRANAARTEDEKTHLRLDHYLIDHLALGLHA